MGDLMSTDCGVRHSPGGPSCILPAGHTGAHYGVVHWSTPAGDDAPTEKLPPIRDTVRRRPPAPDVRELKGAELLRALAAELEHLDD